VRPIRVLVADAHEIFCSGVRIVLAREPGFRVTGVSNLDQLLQAAVASPPDIVIVDAELPPAGAAVAVSRLTELVSTVIVVWGFEPSGEEVLAAIQLGASGYLPKNISSDGLVRALHRISEGEAPMSRDLAMALVDSIHAAKERESKHKRAALLSDREREVLALVARGARNKQIGSALEISELTVKRHIQNILQKLELPSRQAAAEYYSDVLRVATLGSPEEHPAR
jgi:DNA-binding NarL/FixJ family response regulator